MLSTQSQAQSRVSGSRRLVAASPSSLPAAPPPPAAPAASPPPQVDICTPTAKAKLLPNGILIPPASAPPRVKAVIAAANKIRTKPYI